ncbi:5-(carboxyamino)imidazole ribonucleotide mutase [Candidatus Omnitrophota bacterium]
MKKTISIIIGSKSDLETVRQATELLGEFRVNFDLKVLSAHRQPMKLARYVQKASAAGIKLFIAAAGGAAALPGVIAAHTTRPVIGVPVETKSLKGLDSLLSIVQMPSGVPVGCMAVGKSGAKNAAIFALEILALNDKGIADKLLDFKRRLAAPAKKK